MGTIELSQSRLNDWTWVDRYYNDLGKEEFWDYLNKVWNAIEKLLPHQYYVIRTIPVDRQDLFVKFSCLYIIDHGGCEKCGVQFSSDYSRIIRYKLRK